MIQFYKQEGVQWASPVKFRLQGGLLIFVISIMLNIDMLFRLL